MNNFKSRSIIGAAALIATVVSVAAATPLLAAPISVKVAYGDLDMSSKAGVATLEHRIHRAADAVCGPRAGNLAEASNCRTRAIASAEAKLALVHAAGSQLASR